MTAQAPLILSLDLGTTAVKVGLFETTGKFLRLARREQKLLFPNPGWVEQSLADTFTLLTECVREVLKGERRIQAIVLSVQRGSIVPLAADGTPLSNLIIWMDERGLPYVEKIKNEISSSKYYKIAGHPVVPITGVSKILWLYHQAEEVFTQAEVIGNQQTAFLSWLGCKDLVIDNSVGSFFFPFDIQKKEWSNELASQLSFPLEKLPHLVSSSKVVGVLSKRAAEILGLSAGIPLIPGGGDGQCAGAGSGVVQSGMAMVNIGTSTGVQVYLEKPYFDPSEILNCAAHILPQGWELEGHTQASGSVFKWFRDEFVMHEKELRSGDNENAYNLLIDEACQAPPGSEGLLFIPTFYGSTAPVIDSLARGVLLGLSQYHRRAHVIRALLEGISLEIRWMLDAIEAIGIPIKEVRLVGGGASNPAWNQIHADIFQRRIQTISNTDASLTGAAMCASTAIGVFSNLKEAAIAFVQPSNTLEPNPINRSAYEAAYDHYRAVFITLSEHKLFRRK
jgi:xylulokinase